MSNAIRIDDLPPEAYPGQVVTVRIRNIAFGGSGVGEVIEQANGGSELLGITAFVPHTAVGETVRARITEHKKRHIQSELIEILQSSTDRVTPRCAYAGTCGGCELQHIDYDAQLEAKNRMIRGALQAAKMPRYVLDALCEVVPGEPFNYRRRLTLHVNRDGKVGFYRARTRSVVAVTSCDVADPQIATLLPSIQQFGEDVSAYVNSITLDSDERRVVAVLNARYDLGEREQQTVIRRAKELFQSAVLRSDAKEISGFGTQLLDVSLNDVGSVRLRVPAGTFSQVNAKVNRALIAEVLERSRVGAESAVYDLYSGAGNFSLPLARAGADVIAVEVDPRLAAMLRENSERYSLRGRIETVERSVEQFLKSSSLERADVVVADPPRSGLSSVALEMKRLANRLCLISCHQASCVRDLRTLMDDGWHVERIVPFDMFAQTSYTEIVSTLVRDDS